MFNLIRKDFILQKHIFLILLPASLIYLSLDASSIWIGFVFSITIIYSAVSMDEKPAIHTLLNSLPYTRKQIVSAKYIEGLVFTCIVILVTFMGNLLIHKEITAWQDLLFTCGLVLLLVSLTLPLFYKFNGQYFVTGSIVVFAVYLVVLNFFVNNLHDQIRALVGTILSLQNISLYLLIAGLIAILYGCSWLISIQIYRKRVF